MTSSVVTLPLPHTTPFPPTPTLMADCPTLLSQTLSLPHIKRIRNVLVGISGWCVASFKSRGSRTWYITRESCLRKIKGVGVKGGMLQRHKEATSVVNHRSLFWHLRNFSSRKHPKTGWIGGGWYPYLFCRHILFLLNTLTVAHFLLGKLLWSADKPNRFQTWIFFYCLLFCQHNQIYF